MESRLPVAGPSGFLGAGKTTLLNHHAPLPEPELSWLRIDARVGVLESIHAPSVHLALWRRTLPPCLGWWLERFPSASLPEGRVLCRPGQIPAAMKRLIRPPGPSGPMQDMLLEDIAALGRTFGKLAASEFVDVRIEVVEDDACAAFHRDNVGLRLLTTYRGPSTEWVSPADAERALGEQQAFAGPIHDFPRHAVGVFRGRRGDPGGLVHRSPPLRKSGGMRLVLCINTPSEASPAVWAAATAD